MAKYVTFFSYTPETWQKMMNNPGDRTEAARALFEAAGGSLVSFHYMFGEYDGIAMCEAPESSTAAAVAVTVAATGAFSRVETHELIDPTAMRDILGKAKTVGAKYVAPGD